MKTTIKIACAALMLGLAAFAAYADDNPREINVTRVAIHKRFFDIPVELVPRAGYNFKKTENGVTDNAKRVTFTASELHTPFSALMEQMTEERLKQSNIELKTRYSFIWNGKPAELLKIFQTSGKNTIGKWVLIIDHDYDSCWMISGAYDAKNTASAQAVLETLKTAWWPEAEIPRRAVLGTLMARTDPSGTPFRIAGFRQDSLIYTKDGQIPTKSPDGALYVITSVDTGYIPAERRMYYAGDHLSEIERGAKLEIISQTQEMINGYPAVVSVAYTDSEPQGLIYQAVIFRAAEVTLIVGIAKADTAENLDCFHRLTAAFRE